ncbi:MAG TPA: hypothetical protein VGF16_08110 [Bryobacteraceae bacterium]|jgi:DNA-binding CsgD family transcriptional regulator
MSTSLLARTPLPHPAAPAALRFRVARRDDLPHCVELLPKGFRASDAVRRQLVNLWGRLLAAEGRTFTIVEDLDRLHPASIEGFGLSIFVTDRFFDEFCAAPRPYLPALCYERMLAGDDIVLTEDQIRASNSSQGLNIVNLDFGLRTYDLSDSRTKQVLAAGSSAFYFCHAGYRIRAIANEVYGTQAARYMEAGGFRLVRDYQSESRAAFENLAPEEYPYLFLLRREWIQPAVIHPLSQLFAVPPPRIRFSRSERRVLEGALLNESDAQIACRLAISLGGVKKTWQNIYARTQRQIPNLMPAGDGAPEGFRGLEKRRHLLEYLRMHLEELRPSCPDSSRD